MKNKKIALAAVLVLLLVAASYWLYRTYYSPDDTLIKASGTIEATTIEINARAPGLIKTLQLEEGNTVAKGQLLAELSRNDLAAQRERDALAVVAAQNRLSDLQSGAREQEIEEASASVNIARVTCNKADQDYSRSQTLFKEGAISREELEQSEINLELKKNQYHAAQARLNLLKAGNRQGQIDIAQAEVERSQAILKSTAAMLDDLKIYSPRSGTVLSRNYETGEYVQMGASLATIADLDHLWLKVYIPTDDLPAIRLGDPVHFTVSGDTSNYTGVIKQIASKGEFTPKTIQTEKERANVVFAVKIEIDNRSGSLKPGMPADVVIDRRQPHD